MGDKTLASFRTVKNFICNDYPEFEDIKLNYCEIAEKDHKKLWCHFAHTCSCGDDVICICEAMEELSEEQRCGILAHEFGHLFCEMYPKLYPRNTDDNADDVCDREFGIIIYYDDDDLEVVDLPLGDYLDDDEEERAEMPETREKFDRGFFDPDPVSMGEHEKYKDLDKDVVDTEFDDIGM